MLPGSIRFTVTQVSRDEEEGAHEEQVANNEVMTGVRSSPRLSSPTVNDEDNTLYLHLTGDPVSPGKLFTATTQYFRHYMTQNSFGIFGHSFLTGRPVTSLTVDHPHLDHHLQRSETMCRDGALPEMGRLWNALQQLMKRYCREDVNIDESDSDSESE